MTKRISIANAPSGSVDKHQRFMIGVGLDPLAFANTIYFICSSTNPDILDLYINNILVERNKSGLSSELNANNTYIIYDVDNLLKTYVDGVLIEAVNITNVICSSSGIFDFYNGNTLVERMSAV